MVIHPLVSVLLLCVLSVVTLSLINPNIGISALIFTLPFAYGVFNLNLTQIYTFNAVHVMLFCLIFLHLLTSSRKEALLFTFSPIDLYFLLFLAWASISIAWAPNFLFAIIHLFILALMYLLYYITYVFIKNAEALEYALWGWWLVGTVFFLVAIMQYLGILTIGIGYTTDIMEEGYSRVIGFSGSPSAFARVMLLALFAMLGAFQFFQSRFKKALTGMCMVCCLLTIILTLSRSAFIGLFCGLLLYALRYLGKETGKYILFFGIVSAIFFIFGIYSGIHFQDRIESMLRFYQHPSWIIRLAVWAVSVGMLVHTFGLGIGVGGVEAQFSQFFVRPFPVGTVPPHAHSLYMDVLAHFGVIGFTLFIFILIVLALNLYRYNKKLGRSRYGKLLWALSCGLIAIGSQLIITGLLHMSDLWIFIGMTLGCAKIATNDLALKSRNQTEATWIN